ncbi:MAG: YggS family pyridoxal phosphate-dependent enzyme [Mariprofundaceae bacterium]|nr:YggS family pyridoxal phosphate-dependent enzyme [Mariprofundaceae bacterium]
MTDLIADRQLLDRWRLLHDEMEGAGVRMLAVSKYHNDDQVLALAGAGQVDFAESRPQALRDRAQRFPHLNWHMIGPVQKNKARYVGKFATMWHSLCDLECAEAVAKNVEGRVLPVLLQVNISGEEQKQGVAPDQVAGLMEKVRLFDSLKVIGLMGMAARGGDARSSFRSLRLLRDQLGSANLRELCMGMSGDYRIAIEEGATMVRLGTVLFGAGSVEHE